MKFNVDGSTYDKPGPAGCGGILRNERERILALFSGPLGILDSNIVEVMAIKVALGMFVRSIWKGKFGLVIESNSMIAIRWCSDKDNRPWKLWGVFDVIDKLLEDIGNVTLAHIYREGNDLVDSQNQGWVNPICWKRVLILFYNRLLLVRPCCRKGIVAVFWFCISSPSIYV